MQSEAARRCNVVLPGFDFGIDKLFDSPARQAHQMIVMRAFIQLEHRAAALEMVARQQPGLLELRQHPITVASPTSMCSAISAL